jgi:uncharacterized membrane-anchored protein
MSDAKTRQLPVELSEQELLIKGNELAVLNEELSTTESQKKVANQGFKEVLDRTQEQIDRLAKIVREKKEYREVEVVDRKNMDRMTMDTIRLDTGEVVSYRELQGHERNLGLFPVAAGEVQ